MKLRTYPIYKFILIGGVVLGLSACSLSTSSEAVQARVGQDLDTVIADWGFPSGDREVAGRKLVFWDETEISYDDVPKIGLTVPVGSNGGITAEIPLGEAQELRCTRTLELDSKSNVLSAAIDGNNCPYYAPRNWL